MNEVLEKIYKSLGYNIQYLEKELKASDLKVCNVEKYENVVFVTIESGKVKERKYEVAIGDVGMLCNCIGWAIFKRCKHIACALKVIYEMYGEEILKQYLKKAIKEEIVNVQ
jgi:hypothetical protein